MGRGLRSSIRLQRLERLEARFGGRTAGTPDTSFDPSQLTREERDELEGLSSKLRRHPDGRWGFAALDDAELEQLRELVLKGQPGIRDEHGAAH